MANPSFVDAILNWRWAGWLARLMLVSAYLLGGIVKLIDWSGAVAEQAHFGMHPAPAWAAVAIAVELLAPILILSGRLVWLGTGMLGVLTLIASLTANAFWAMPAGQERFMATNSFFEHIGLIGGLALVAILEKHRA